MKKTALLSAVIMLAAVYGAFAQTQPSNPDDIFNKVVPIVKVYTHALGYKVVFVKSNLEMGSIYCPLTWFGKAAGKGIIVWEIPGEVSYLSIFWLNGKFDHIVLHVPSNSDSPIWGILETSADMSSQFNIEEPKLVF